jgi:hypothetical protein
MTLAFAVLRVRLSLCDAQCIEGEGRKVPPEHEGDGPVHREPRRPRRELGQATHHERHPQPEGAGQAPEQAETLVGGYPDTRADCTDGAGSKPPVLPVPGHRVHIDPADIGPRVMLGPEQAPSPARCEARTGIR